MTDFTVLVEAFEEAGARPLPPEFSLESSMSEVGLDSMQFMTAIMLIEEATGTTLSDEQVEAVIGARTVRDVLQVFTVVAA